MIEVGFNWVLKELIAIFEGNINFIDGVITKVIQN